MTLTPESLAAGAGFREQKKEKEPQYNGDENTGIKGEIPRLEHLAGVEEFLEALCFCADEVGVVVVVGDLRNTAGDGHGAERRDEGRQLAAGDQLAVDEADEQAADQRNEDGDPRVDALRH